jgi:tubulin alpha
MDGSILNDSHYGNRDIMFRETSKGQYVCRSIFIDLDPTPIDEIIKGPLKYLIEKDNLIKGKEDAANNYIRGHYTLGKEKMDLVLN